MSVKLNPYAKLAFTAVDSFYKVLLLISWMMIPANYGRQVCEKQEQCRDAAVELGEQLDIFLSLSLDVAELQERELSRQAVAVMLHLIEDVSNYFCENAQKGAFGTTLCSHCFKKINEIICDSRSLKIERPSRETGEFQERIRSRERTV